MIKIIRILFLALVLSGCAYEPIMLKKNYNFIISNIETDGETYTVDLYWKGELK